MAVAENIFLGREPLGKFGLIDKRKLYADTKALLNQLEIEINPAALMDPRELKARFGKRVVFWGGGVDTQQTLPNGSPDEVRQQVLERLRVFGPGGGYVFNTIHNVQPKSPIENVLAMYETVREHGHYPLNR